MKLFGISSQMALLVYLSIVQSGLAAESVHATYTVPVKDDRLKRFATFEIAGALAERTPQGLSLNFDLPDELVGNNIVHVELKQTSANSAGDIHLAGERGKADCTETTGATELNCSIAYVGDFPYTAKVARHLFFKDVFHFSDRVAVARAFESDPIGTLQIRFAAAPR